MSYVVSYGRSFNDFVAPCINTFETPAYCASLSRDFIGEAPSLALMSSDVSSFSVVRDLSGFCLAVNQTFSAY
jgi:hypothetical protein